MCYNIAMMTLTFLLTVTYEKAMRLLSEAVILLYSCFRSGLLWQAAGMGLLTVMIFFLPALWISWRIAGKRCRGERGGRHPEGNFVGAACAASDLVRSTFDVCLRNGWNYRACAGPSDRMAGKLSLAGRFACRASGVGVGAAPFVSAGTFRNGSGSSSDGGNTGGSGEEEPSGALRCREP